MVDISSIKNISVVGAGLIDIDQKSIDLALAVMESSLSKFIHSFLTLYLRNSKLKSMDFLLEFKKSKINYNLLKSSNNFSKFFCF